MLTLKDGIYHFESLVDLLAIFTSRQDNLAADKDQKHDLGLDHAIDEAREQLRLVRAEVLVAGVKTLEADGELNVARANDILNLEIRKLSAVAELLDDSGAAETNKAVRSGQPHT